MSKTLTPFEQSLKDKMSGHEARYEPQDWLDLQNRLKTKTVSGANANLVAMAATVAVLIAGSVVYYRTQIASTAAKMATESSRFVNSDNQIQPIFYSEAGNAAIIDSANTAVEFNSNETTATQTSGSNKKQDTAASLNQGLNNTAHAIASETKNSVAEEKPSNAVGFTANTKEACQGVEVEFGVTNGPDGGSYLWNFGDGHFSSDINPKHKYAKAGTYDVSLSITSDHGQINTTVMPDLITIRPAPTANFKWEFVNENPEQPQLKIMNNSDNASSYQWKFADGTTSKEVSPTLNVVKKGKQLVSLAVVNEFGCKDDAIKTIFVNADYNLGATSGFNPSKESFMPSGLKDNKVKFEMSIFDMSGKKVYETTSKAKGWDGKMPDGTIAASGSQFSWKVVMTTDNNKEEKYFNGIVTIIP